MDTRFMSMVESQPPFNQTRLFVVMGVAGCGKSTIGAGVARRIGGTFIDGDDFHPHANIDKMSRGEPLTDDDRWPWLDIVAENLSSRSGRVLVGCSALKRKYRERITSAAAEAVCFLFLDGTKQLIESRMAARTGHFMPTSLLDSQFATLEVPAPSEHAITFDISGSEDEIIDAISQRIET